MVYVAPADFRLPTVKPYCIGITLDASQDISDANLTSLIAEQSAALDRYTGDHFETETGVTVKADGNEDAYITVAKRIQSVTSIAVTYPGGASVTVPSTSFTFEAFTGDYSQIDHESIISLWPGMYLWPGGWPGGYRNISIVGNLGWPACPDEIKRALALMVWGVAKPGAEPLNRAVRWSTASESYDAGMTSPTGLPEADAIIKRFRRVAYA